MDNNEKNQQQGQLQLELPQEVAQVEVHQPLHRRCTCRRRRYQQLERLGICPASLSGAVSGPYLHVPYRCLLMTGIRVHIEA
nr:hypothetical protein [Prevotella sp. tf2-5]